VKRAFAVGVTPGLGVAAEADGRIVYTVGLGHADVDGDVAITDSTLGISPSASGFC
jgi:hypothetical protein